MEMLYEFEIEEDYPLGTTPEDELNLLLDEINKTGVNINLDLVRRAFELCLEFHKGQKRNSGAPYYRHPIKTALILINEINLFDTESIVASLLHDSIEDVVGETKEAKEIQKEIRRNIIFNEFGNNILRIIEAVTKFKHSETSLIKDKAQTYRKLFLSLVKDVRVILIKLADRLHNMRTLHYLKEKKQKEVAKETLSFYTPFAHRLGLNKIKIELEDRALYFYDHEKYEEIRIALRDKRRDFMSNIQMFVENIENTLNEQKVGNILTIVHKNIYEIYEMMEQGQSISDIDNFYSIVITTKSNDKYECYKVHGILVNAFNPVSQLIDYIAQPKINFYQSLNTRLVGPDGKLVEVLIRTEEMDRLAEGGIAANFSIQEGRIRALELDDEEIEDWGLWMGDMIKEKGDEAAQIIWTSIKNNIFDQEINVYSPDGYPIKLPKGACPIDFAFKISKDLGLHCLSAKVNGQIKELNYQLRNSDRVYIISSPNNYPKPDWLNYVVSQKAEVQLHKYFDDHPNIQINEVEEKKDFIVKLVIRGEDKLGMLQKITEALDRTSIKRISLDTSGSDFGGALSIIVRDYEHLNSLYAKLFSIKGIRSVEQIEEEE